ncbi:MAG: thiamine phosphate synthase [Firmicutes bacterium]|nr:thiamine phosphate synthase [Bacillota bacterium]
MLYFVTNRKLIKKGFFDVIEKAVNGGVDFIILREKDLEYKELYSIASEIKNIIKDKKTRLIINGNIDVVKNLNLDGYHTGFNEFVRESITWNGLVGVSIHSLEEAIIAEKKGADYLLAGHVFKTDCKKGLTPRGVEFIKELTRKVKIPVIAIGGIKPYNVKKVISAGAYGIAVMSSIMMDENPKDLVKEYIYCIRS